MTQKTEWQPLDPFEGDSKDYAVTGPLNVSQFKAELEEKTGTEVHLALVSPDPDVEPSEDAPATLFVSPESIDGRTVHGLLKTHEVDPSFGVPEDHKELAAIKAKVSKGDTLSAKEIHTALGHVLGVRG